MTSRHLISVQLPRIRRGIPVYSGNGPCYADYLRTIIIGRVIGVDQAGAPDLPISAFPEVESLTTLVGDLAQLTPC